MCHSGILVGFKLDENIKNQAKAFYICEVYLYICESFLVIKLIEFGIYFNILKHVLKYLCIFLNIFKGIQWVLVMRWGPWNKVALSRVNFV